MSTVEVKHVNTASHDDPEALVTAKQLTIRDFRRRAARDANLDAESWLREVYRYGASTARADEERVWRTGAIWIPASMVGFLAVPFALATSPISIAFVALPSILLIRFWNSVAEQRLASEKRSMVWARAIRLELGLDDTPAHAELESRRRIKRARARLTGWVTFLWILVVLAGVYTHLVNTEVLPTFEQSLNQLWDFTFPDTASNTPTPLDTH